MSRHIRSNPTALLIVLILCVITTTAPGTTRVSVDVVVDPRPPSSPVSLLAAADGNFYGTTSTGGQNNSGTFFKSTPSGVVTQLSSFAANGPQRISSLVESADGHFYGLAVIYNNGSDQDAIVRLTREGVPTVLFSFLNDAASEPTGIIPALDGNLYGTTRSGGANGGGSAFKMAPGGVLTFIADFNVPDSAPGELVQAGDGNFYGVLTERNQSGQAGIFRMTPAGVVKIIHTFNSSTEGFAPDGLAIGSDGNLYGTTAAPTEYGAARAIFRSTLSGEVSVLTRSTELFGISVRLVAAPDGNFYVAKTSHYDGNGSFLPGRVFRVALDGTVIPFHDFSEGSAGPYPANLTVGSDGQLYGTSYLGGSRSGGTIFRLAMDGAVTPIYAFALQIAPSSSLVEGPDGDFYGTTEQGGTHFSGTVFRMTPEGIVRTLINFGEPNGANPKSELLLANDGDFYGTTHGGGGYGTVFRTTPAGVLTTLFNFDGASGRNPTTALVQGADDLLYGVTPSGGSGSYGTIFRVSPAGAFSNVANFSAGNGYSPKALAKTSDGQFYGITPATAFRLSADGNVSTMHAFSVNQGTPMSLSPSADGNVYGLAAAGAGGMVFKLNSAGTFSTVTDLKDTNTFVLPQDGVTVGTDGNLYLQLKGPSETRIVRISPDGITTTLGSLGAEHGTAFRKLVEARDGRFYGASYASYNAGEIFRVHLLRPQVSSISPMGAPAGAEVVITGKSFTDAFNVTFGSVPASSFKVDSDSQITATMPDAVMGTGVSIGTPVGIGTFPPGSVPPGPAVNISTRANVGTGDHAMIGGFIIQGGPAKKVIVRAIGPSLAAFGVSGFLANPALELRDAAGVVVGSNDNWADSSEKQAIINTNIPPSDSLESAIVATLDPGGYTAVVRGEGGAGGVALVEVYDLDKNGGRLANISTRSRVQTVDRVMIGGFIIGGDAPGKVLVRAIGPSLSQATPPVADTLSDPQLELRDVDGNLMASNDNWKEGLQRQQIEDTTIAPSEDNESAVVATLDPGNYTAIVRGANGTTGIGLVEVYKLD